MALLAERFGFSTFVRDDGIRSVESAVLPEREGTIVETAELIANAGGPPRFASSVARISPGRALTSGPFV